VATNTATGAATLNATASAIAACPAGFTRVLGGGASLSGAQIAVEQVTITQTRPNPASGTPTGWFAAAQVHLAGTMTWTLTVYVICAP
jgi:hypothetical protein